MILHNLSTGVISTPPPIVSRVFQDLSSGAPFCFSSTNDTSACACIIRCGTPHGFNIYVRKWMCIYIYYIYIYVYIYIHIYIYIYTFKCQDPKFNVQPQQRPKLEFWVLVLRIFPKQSLRYGVLVHLKAGERIIKIQRLRSGGHNDSRRRFINIDAFDPPLLLQREGHSTTLAAATASFLSPMPTKRLRESLSFSKV